MNILIAGAGNVGRYLAHMLVEADHSVTLVEYQESQVERAMQESGATVVWGDASEPSVLERAGIRRMDVVVAATGDDEDNIVISNMAKVEFEVPRVVGCVKNALNAWLYEPDIGVDVVVSAPHTIAQLIEEEVVSGSVVQLLQLPHGQATILEAMVPAGSPVAGSAIGDVPWPPGCIPTAIIRGSELLAALPGNVIHAEDRLLCVTNAADSSVLHALVGGTAIASADGP